MSTKNIPGFNAENSIYTNSRHYRKAIYFDSQNNFAKIEPAAPRICRGLSRLVWDAYFDGDYSRAEFFLGAMEGAGCFD